MVNPDIKEPSACKDCPYSYWDVEFEVWICGTASGMCIKALGEEEDW